MLGALVFLWIVIIANVAGLLAVVLGFTKYRHGWFVLGTAALSFILGALISLTVKLGPSVAKHVWIAFLAPVLLGVVGFCLWIRRKI